MKTVKNFKSFNRAPVFLAIGNFDGLHLGHRKIIGKLVREAKNEGALSMAITFDPHPQEVFWPKKKFKFLNTQKEKNFLFEKTGLDVLAKIRFSKKMAATSPRKFFLLLKKNLDLKKIIVGFNFALGAGKSGQINNLKALGRQLGFGVEALKPVKFKNRIISSSLLRGLINSGHLERACLKLAAFYPVFGPVVPGKGLGRQLGFPTANLKIEGDKLIPPKGVYLAKVLLNGRLKPALVNIGQKKEAPFFEFEVFVLNFSGNLYGRILKVFLIKKMRSEKKFDTFGALSRQISRDVKTAQHLFFQKKLQHRLLAKLINLD